MDETGFTQFAAVANVAHRARVSLEEAEEAVRVLTSPDIDSSDPDNEGRRIERVNGGWVVLNAEKYRALATRAVAQEKTRERVAKFRAKGRAVTIGNAHVTTSNGELRSETPSEAEAGSETKQSLPAKPPVKLPLKPRQPNPCFDALCVFEGIASAEIGAAGSRIGRQLQIIKASTPEVTPEEIARRGRAYVKQWPAIAPTAAGLAKHWPSLGSNGHAASGPSPITEPADWRARLLSAYPDNVHSSNPTNWPHKSRQDQLDIIDALQRADKTHE